MAETTKKWYVVRAISGQELKVKSYIEQEIARRGMNDYLAGVMVPMEKFFSVSGGKKVSKERPFFPGYVMIEANLDGEMLHLLQGIPGVVGFLSDRPGGDPVPLCKSEVNRMLGKVDEMADMPESVVIPFVVGEAVKVIDGPFNGFDGTVEEVTDYLEENGLTFPVVMDTTGELFYWYGISAFPTTFMIDANGNVYGYVSGALTADMMESIVQQTMESVE